MKFVRVVSAILIFVGTLVAIVRSSVPTVFVVGLMACITDTETPTPAPSLPPAGSPTAGGPVATPTAGPSLTQTPGPSATNTAIPTATIAPMLGVCGEEGRMSDGFCSVSAVCPPGMMCNEAACECMEREPCGPNGEEGEVCNQTGTCPGVLVCDPDLCECVEPSCISLGGGVCDGICPLGQYCEDVTCACEIEEPVCPSYLSNGECNPTAKCSIGVCTEQCICAPRDCNQPLDCGGCNPGEVCERDPDDPQQASCKCVPIPIT